MTPYDFNLEPTADDETVERLFEAYSSDPEKVAEADEYMEGVLEEGFYTKLESVFADIHEKGLIPELYEDLMQRAKIASKAREERIMWLAERDAPRAFEKPEDYDADL